MQPSRDIFVTVAMKVLNRRLGEVVDVVHDSSNLGCLSSLTGLATEVKLVVVRLCTR